MDVASILLGWLLGMLSPVVVSRIVRRYKKKDLHGGILREVGNIKTRLVFLAYTLGQKYGRYDKDLISWCINNIDPKGNESVIEAYNMQLNASDEQFAAIKQKYRAVDDVGQTLKKFTLAFTELHLSDFSLFSQQLQSAIFELKARLEILNSEIDLYQKYFFMTFSSDVSSENHERIRQDLFKKYEIIQVMAERVVDQITVVEQTDKI